MTDAATQEPGQLLGAIFSASPDAVVVVDEAETIVLSSPAVTPLFGYYPEELVGESISVLIPAELRAPHGDHLRAFFAAPRPRQMGAGLELAGQHRGGGRFAVDVSLAPVEVRGRRYVAAFVRDARERQRGVDRVHAVHEVTQRLLAGDEVSDILPFIAASARALADAAVAWLVTPSPSDHDRLVIAAADGAGAASLLGVEISAGTGRHVEVMRRGSAEAIDDLSAADDMVDSLRDLGVGPALLAPLMARGRPLGVLGIARAGGEEPFEPVDLAFAELFARATATAMELGEARSEIARLDILNEDERIARDLHDTIIQQLFAIGMSLQAARGMAVGVVGERIDSAVSDLDHVIRDIRSTIFRLPVRAPEVHGLRQQMLQLADRHGVDLGFTPRVAFHGPVDFAISETVIEHLLKVLAEALSNVSRHASASSVQAVAEVESDFLVLSVADDGVGIPEGPGVGEGLHNMRARATTLGGTFTIGPREPRGTILEWRVPL